MAGPGVAGMRRQAQVFGIFYRPFHQPAGRCRPERYDITEGRNAVIEFLKILAPRRESAKRVLHAQAIAIDQKRGEFDGKEPLKTLAGFRSAKDVFPETFESLGQTATAVLFGENLIPENPGAVIRVDDPVEFLERRK